MSDHQPCVEHLRAINSDVVRRFIEAINDSWNFDVMREIVTEDFVFTIPFPPDWFRVRYEGREEALAFLDHVRELMDPENLHDFRIDTYASDPGEVVAHYRSATRMKSTNLPYCTSTSDASRSATLKSRASLSTSTRYDMSLRSAAR